MELTDEEKVKVYDAAFEMAVDMCTAHIAVQRLQMLSRLGDKQLGIALQDGEVNKLCEPYEGKVDDDIDKLCALLGVKEAERNAFVKEATMRLEKRKREEAERLMSMQKGE